MAVKLRRLGWAFVVGAEDVNIGFVDTYSTYRIPPESIAEHRLTRDVEEKVVLQYLTYWDGTETTSWEREEEL